MQIALERDGARLWLAWPGDSALAELRIPAPVAPDGEPLAWACPKMTNPAFVAAELDAGRTVAGGEVLGDLLPADWTGFEPSPMFADPAVLDAIADTATACSTESTRYYLQGVLIHEMGDTAVAVATDGHRLYRARLGYGDGHAPAREGNAIIPAAGLALLAKMRKAWGNPTSAAARYVGRGAVAWTFANGAQLMAPFIDGVFPDYVRVIPIASSIDAEITIADATAARADLAAGIKAAKLADAPGAWLKIGEDAAVTYRACDESVRVHPVAGVTMPPRAAIPAERDASGKRKHSAEPAFDSVAFKASYLADALAYLGAAGRMVIRARDAGSPVRIESGDRLAVVMPVRLAQAMG